MIRTCLAAGAALGALSVGGWAPGPAPLPLPEVVLPPPAPEMAPVIVLPHMEAPAVAPVPTVAPPRRIWCLVTAYTPDDAYTPYTGVTSTGKRVERHPYGVAAAPGAIPYGAEVRIAGYRGGRWMTVDDTGGMLRQSWRRGIIHLDLRFKTVRSALQWGRRWMWVEVR